jgi:hypothetical protein
VGLLKVDLKDVKESEAVEEGEYELRIDFAEEGESKKGNPMVTLGIKILDAPIQNAGLVYHYLVVPTESTDEKAAYMMKLNLKRFAGVLGWSEEQMGSMEATDMVGETFKCALEQEEGDDNVVRNKLRLPRLRE